MTGVLPNGGVAPAQTQGGTTTATLAAGCNRLFYPVNCNTRFDPVAMNNLISELLNAVTQLGASYNCNVNNNLALGLQNLGIPCRSNLTTAPSNGRPTAFLNNTVTPQLLMVWNCAANNGAGGYQPIALNGRAPNQFSINANGNTDAPTDAVFQAQFSNPPQNGDQVCVANTATTPPTQRCYQRVNNAWQPLPTGCTRCPNVFSFTQPNNNTPPTNAQFAAQFGANPQNGDRICVLNQATNQTTCYNRVNNAWVADPAAANVTPNTFNTNVNGNTNAPTDAAFQTQFGRAPVDQDRLCVANIANPASPVRQCYTRINNTWVADPAAATGTSSVFCAGEAGPQAATGGGTPSLANTAVLATLPQGNGNPWTLSQISRNGGFPTPQGGNQGGSNTWSVRIWQPGLPTPTDLINVPGEFDLPASSQVRIQRLLPTGADQVYQWCFVQRA